MTFLLYIGKNKDFLRKFSKLENVQMIYAQNYQDAITICIRLKVRENIIVLHEQGEMNGDIEQIGAFRKKFYQAYVVLITDRLTPEASKVYLNSGINDTVSLNITTARLRQKIDIINKRQELLYAHNRKKKDVRHFILPQWKRCFDILFSGAALIFLSPVFLLIAIAIRMESKGPVIYKSKRVGTNYTIFNFLKFRSMYTDADKKLKDLAGQNQYQPEGTPEIAKDFSMEELGGLMFGDDGVIDNGGMLVSDDFIIPEEEFISRQNALDESPFIKIEKDPRVTKVGRVLRKYSLDELPQLVNILKGDMSVVGPRPERPELAEEYEKTMPEFEFRLQVKAGLTGYAQVTGLYDTLPYDKLKMDLMYIENYSIFLDLRIILMTLKTALFPGETNEEANAHDAQELLYQEEHMQEQEQEKGDHS